MTEFQIAIFIFCVGGIVTFATLILILKGHFYWEGRNPFD